MGQCFAEGGRRTVNEVKVTGTTVCYVRSLSPASLTFEEDDFNQFHKIFHLIAMSPFSKQSHVHMGLFSAGHCHVQPRLEMLFHSHHKLNLVQR